MRLLILSDLHANLPALEAVAADSQGRFDQIVCLGDVVGYGADPNGVTLWTREHASATVRGNHDRACTGDPVIADFSENARIAALWTLRHLERPVFDYLRALPVGPLEVSGVFLSHGSPRDEDEYIVTKNDAAHLYRDLPGKVTFFGHTHIQIGFGMRRGKVWLLPPPDLTDEEMVFQLEPETFYLLNPGSVGQPRDADPRAAYALYDCVTRCVTFRRVPYNVSAAQNKILASKLPVFLAKRLSMGR